MHLLTYMYALTNMHYVVECKNHIVIFFNIILLDNVCVKNKSNKKEKS